MSFGDKISEFTCIQPFKKLIKEHNEYDNAYISVLFHQILKNIEILLEE